VRRNECFDALTGVIRRTFPRSFLGSEKLIQLGFQFFRIGFVAFPRACRWAGCFFAVFNRKRLLCLLEPLPFKKKLPLKLRQEFIDPIGEQQLSKALQILNWMR
jgi:hypothetical protein